MKNVLLVLLTCWIVSGCSTREQSEGDKLVGAWRGNVQFKTGAFASIKDLEFMYVFNAGGTMTESSNYDGAPPVPPAYGVWRKTGPRQFEAKYEFYSTKALSSLDEIRSGGSWLPSGRGMFMERITLSEDGKTFTSAIVYNAADRDGQQTESGSTAEVRATRLEF